MRTKKRIAVLPLLFVASIAGVQPAEAAVTFYSNLASWQLSANTTTVLDLNSLAPVNGFVSYGSPGSVDLGPLTLGSTGPLFAQNNNLWGTGGYLSAQQLTGATVTLSFDNPVTAFAFDYAAGSSLTISVSSQSTTLPGGTYPPFIMSFFGVTADAPFSSASFTMSGSGTDLDNLRLGSIAAVPEPATWAMMILGFCVIGGALRRRRPAAPGQLV